MPSVTHIGIDVGSTLIRVVEASRGKDRPVIENFAHVPMPEGAVVNGVIVDGPTVTSALRSLWSTQKLTTRSVVLGVTHQQVVVRQVEVSNLPPKELRQALPFQVRDVLPLPVEQAVLDFHPLENPGNNETVTGLLIAAPKEPVLNTVRAVENAGLHVERVDLACFAALRSSSTIDSVPEAVIDIGGSSTNIIIHTDGIPHLVRTIARGGGEITRLISTRLGLPTPEAELQKCRVGLIKGEGPDTAEVIVEAIRPLVSEMRSSLNYHASSNPHQPVRRLALVGGTAMLPGLPALLTEQLQIPTVLPDTLQRVGDSRNGGRHDVLGRFRSSAAVAVGLTLGAA